MRILVLGFRVGLARCAGAPSGSPVPAPTPVTVSRPVLAHSVRRRWRGPFFGLGPHLPGDGGPGGWYNAASSRNRQILVT
jgi:hypothetical protein